MAKMNFSSHVMNVFNEMNTDCIIHISTKRNRVTNTDFFICIYKFASSLPGLPLNLIAVFPKLI